MVNSTAFFATSFNNIYIPLGKTSPRAVDVALRGRRRAGAERTGHVGLLQAVLAETHRVAARGRPYKNTGRAALAGEGTADDAVL